jgi:hypothetical protein
MAGVLMFSTCAHATTLLSLSITSPIATTSTTAIQTKDFPPENVTIQCNFTYGSGGTSADAYVQTSLDGDTTWVDVAQCHFTTSSLRELFNLSALTPVTTAYTATDGTITANTSKDGLLGSKIRVKYVTTGTYAGDVQSGRSRTQP